MWYKYFAKESWNLRIFRYFGMAEINFKESEPQIQPR
jgi:hypothetical protein